VKQLNYCSEYRETPLSSGNPQALLIAESMGDLISREISVSTTEKPFANTQATQPVEWNPVSGSAVTLLQRTASYIPPFAGPLGYKEKTWQAGSRQTTILTALLVLMAAFAGSGCASYHRFRPTPVEYSGISREGKDVGDMTDAAVVSYADRVQDTLRKRFHIARIARETSSTMQVLLAGAAGISAAFTAGATAVAGMAFGSAAMPQLGGIFDTGARAVAYEQAVAKISVAENAYFRARAGRSPVVPDNVLTVEGALLYEAINGATDAVELFQAGMLPTLDQMRRAEALELQRMAALRTGGGRVGGGETGASDIGSEPSPPKHPVDPLDSRRKKLLSRVPKLESGVAGSVLQELNLPVPPTDQDARNQLGLEIEVATDPLLGRIENAMRKDNTQRKREELVQLIKTLSNGQPAAILTALRKGTPTSDKDARVSLKVLISNADSNLLTEIESKMRNPPPVPDIDVVDSSPTPVPELPLTSAQEQVLREQLIQEIKPFDLGRANLVLERIGKTRQTNEREAQLEIKKSISDANGPALIELRRLIRGS
jgi:hypothetical protein